jgi:enoyl-CoA hydratase/carnithine racemase
LGVPEVTLGLLPGNGGTQRLPRLIGRQKAMELLLTGKPLDPKTAVALGVVDRLLPPDQLLPEAIAFAATLAKGPTMAIGEIKLVAKQGLEMPLESALGLERAGIFRLFETADAQEGLRAFAEKRKPSWKGE